MTKYKYVQIRAFKIDMFIYGNQFALLSQWSTWLQSRMSRVWFPGLEQ